MTTLSLNMAITGEFLCSTSLLDSGLKQRNNSAFNETLRLCRCFMFDFYVLIKNKKKKLGLTECYGNRGNVYIMHICTFLEVPGSWIHRASSVLEQIFGS